MRQGAVEDKAPDRHAITSTVRPADLAQIGLDRAFGFAVEGAGRLVEDQDRRIDDASPGNDDALALAAQDVTLAVR